MARIQGDVRGGVVVPIVDQVHHAWHHRHRVTVEEWVVLFVNRVAQRKPVGEFKDEVS